MAVDVIEEDARWTEAGLEALSDRAIAAVEAHMGLDGEVFETVVMGCDDARIAELNGEFRAKGQATNVLSWPGEERAAESPGASPALPDPDGADIELGDIAIAYETCVREAAEQGKDFQAHVTHLLVHGMLHLLGYDHIHDKDAALMERLEVEILGKLGLSDPYG
ncbi:rRNA maturation RNase YbeY [Aliiroseovarius subalbicans]|uniref:rRNA maturation RNase YbeY n=1 Tax=Aliiroseovarius subalbicans TaxID=2925840 RepID=UPI001F593CDB|nr:rRNA maturation RNase YbeY [Aliiroseovarius subalbicans]MCI2400282.1 rRNA maturation RNase YbeY [Aliiroseovarius subalbicans]